MQDSTDWLLITEQQSLVLDSEERLPSQSDQTPFLDSVQFKQQDWLTQNDCQHLSQVVNEHHLIPNQSEHLISDHSEHLPHFTVERDQMTQSSKESSQETMSEEPSELVLKYTIDPIFRSKFAQGKLNEWQLQMKSEQQSQQRGRLRKEQVLVTEQIEHRTDLIREAEQQQKEVVIAGQKRRKKAEKRKQRRLEDLDRRISQRMRMMEDQRLEWEQETQEMKDRKRAGFWARTIHPFQPDYDRHRKFEEEEQQVVLDNLQRRKNTVERNLRRLAEVKSKVGQSLMYSQQRRKQDRMELKDRITHQNRMIQERRKMVEDEQQRRMISEEQSKTARVQNLEQLRRDVLETGEHRMIREREIRQEDSEDLKSRQSERAAKIQSDRVVMKERRENRIRQERKNVQQTITDLEERRQQLSSEQKSRVELRNDQIRMKKTDLQILQLLDQCENGLTLPELCSMLESDVDIATLSSWIDERPSLKRWTRTIGSTNNRRVMFVKHARRLRVVSAFYSTENVLTALETTDTVSETIELLSGLRMIHLPRFEIVRDGHGQLVYVDHIAQLTYHNDPRPVPLPWKKCRTQKGKAYYVNQATEQTSWDHPNGPLQIRHDPTEDRSEESINKVRKRALLNAVRMIHYKFNLTGMPIADFLPFYQSEFGVPFPIHLFSDDSVAQLFANNGYLSRNVMIQNSQLISKKK